MRPPPRARLPATSIGRWNSNASCVVVGPDMVITTRHQGGGVGSTVVVGGVSYTVSNVWYDVDPNVPDLQVAELAGANFKQYAKINTTGAEAGRKWTVAIGGYGKGRGATLFYKNDPNIPFGYAWDGSGNTTLRWGENTLDNGTVGIETGMYTNLLTAHYYRPGSALALPDQAGVAEFDSGGGWFRNVGGAWYVVGLSYGTDHATVSATWWHDPNASSDPNANPDAIYAVRVFSYSSWINGVLAPITTNCTVASGNWGDAGAWSNGAPTPHANTNISNGGTVTINLGANACPTLTLGAAAGQSGNVNMSGGALNCIAEYVGNAGAGAFAQTGGDHSVDGNLAIGLASGGRGFLHAFGWQPQRRAERVRGRCGHRLLHAERRTAHDRGAGCTSGPPTATARTSCRPGNSSCRR